MEAVFVVQIRQQGHCSNRVGCMTMRCRTMRLDHPSALALWRKSDSLLEVASPWGEGNGGRSPKHPYLVEMAQVIPTCLFYFEDIAANHIVKWWPSGVFTFYLLPWISVLTGHGTPGLPCLTAFLDLLVSPFAEVGI